MGKLIYSFDFDPKTSLSGKYTIVRKLGGGWEGEVYIVRERMTGILRAAKFFLPHRNPQNRSVNFYAKKLHKLRNCDILIRYITQEVIDYEGHRVTYLVSEYVEGDPLYNFLTHQKGRRLSVFQGLHLLHALAKGIEDIHNMREYHGDLHTGNVIVQRHGLSFNLKLLDMFHWGRPSSDNISSDVCNLVRIFYDVLGGQEHYAGHPTQVKNICCGLKNSLILKKFKTAGELRNYLEHLTWE